MADLTPAGSACSPSFAYAKRRKIIVQNEPLRLFATAIGVQHLRFLDRSQRSQRDGLSFSTLKNSRTVRARQNAHFATDGSQILVATTVNAFLLFQDTDAKRLLLDVIECLRDRKGIGLRMFFEN